MRSVIRLALTLSACTVLGTLPAYAQATRTWVSGVGDDVNPCSRTAPCKTFAGAISKTATGGEISVLDPGGFGAVTITKSITINGDGTLAGILAAGTNGIIINAPAGSVVTIRNVSINGAGTGLNGIRILSASQVTIDKVDISGFTTNGVEVNSSITTLVNIKDSHIRTVTNGVRVFPGAAPRVDVFVEHTTIKGTQNGVNTTGGFTNIANSNLSHNPGAGVLAGGGTVNIEGSTMTGNGTGAVAAAGTMRLSNNSFYDNGSGVGCGPGTTLSVGDNRSAGNTAPGCLPSGTVPVL